MAYVVFCTLILGVFVVIPPLLFYRFSATTTDVSIFSLFALGSDRQMAPDKLRKLWQLFESFQIIKHTKEKSLSSSASSSSFSNHKSQLKKVCTRLNDCMLDSTETRNSCIQLIAVEVNDTQNKSIILLCHFKWLCFLSHPMGERVCVVRLLLLLISAHSVA